MANISDDIRAYVRELVTEQLGRTDNKDRVLTASQEPDKNDSAYLNVWANQSDESHLVKDTGDE